MSHTRNPDEPVITTSAPANALTHNTIQLLQRVVDAAATATAMQAIHAAPTIIIKPDIQKIHRTTKKVKTKSSTPSISIFASSDSKTEISDQLTLFHPGLMFQHRTSLQTKDLFTRTLNSKKLLAKDMSDESAKEFSRQIEGTYQVSMAIPYVNGMEHFNRLNMIGKCKINSSVASRSIKVLRYLFFHIQNNSNPTFVKKNHELLNEFLTFFANIVKQFNTEQLTKPVAINNRALRIPQLQASLLDAKDPMSLQSSLLAQQEKKSTATLEEKTKKTFHDIDQPETLLLIKISLHEHIYSKQTSNTKEKKTTDSFKRITISNKYLEAVEAALIADIQKIRHQTGAASVELNKLRGYRKDKLDKLDDATKKHLLDLFEAAKTQFNDKHNLHIQLEKEKHFLGNDQKTSVKPVAFLKQISSFQSTFADAQQLKGDEKYQGNNDVPYVLTKMEDALFSTELDSLKLFLKKMQQKLTLANESNRYIAAVVVAEIFNYINDVCNPHLHEYLKNLTDVNFRDLYRDRNLWVHSLDSMDQTNQLPSEIHSKYAINIKRATNIITKLNSLTFKDVTSFIPPIVEKHKDQKTNVKNTHQRNFDKFPDVTKRHEILTDHCLNGVRLIQLINVTTAEITSKPDESLNLNCLNSTLHVLHDMDFKDETKARHAIKLDTLLQCLGESLGGLQRIPSTPGAPSNTKNSDVVVFHIEKTNLKAGALSHLVQLIAVSRDYRNVANHCSHFDINRADELIYYLVHHKNEIKDELKAFYEALTKTYAVEYPDPKINADIAIKNFNLLFDDPSSAATTLNHNKFNTCTIL